MPLDNVLNFRFDPFTETYSLNDISNEAHAIPANTPYYVRLKEVPKEDSPTAVSVYDITQDTGMTEVSGAPGDNEYRVDYKYQTGYIQFNSADANHNIRVTYKGLGSRILGELWNDRFSLFKAHKHDGNNEDQTDAEADIVDTFHASATPTANQLLALDANVKIPGGVVNGMTVLRTIAEGEKTSTAAYPIFTTLITYVNVYIPIGTTKLSIKVRIKVDNTDHTAYVRLKVGSAVGAHMNTSYDTWQEKTPIVENPDTGWQTVLVEGSKGGATTMYFDGDYISAVIASG